MHNVAVNSFAKSNNKNAWFDCVHTKQRKKNQQVKKEQPEPNSYQPNRKISSMRRIFDIYLHSLSKYMARIAQRGHKLTNNWKPFNKDLWAQL